MCGIEPEKEPREKFEPLPTQAHLHKIILAKKLREWHIHNCSMCDYPCGFRFDHSAQTVHVFYDSGCHCCRLPWRSSSLEKVIERLAIQSHPKTIQRYKKFWSLDAGDD